MRVGVTILAMYFAGMALFGQSSTAAEFTPTRRALLFGAGAAAATLIVPKPALVNPEPEMVFEFTIPGSLHSIYAPSKLTLEEENSIYRHIVGQHIEGMREHRKHLESLQKSRRIYQGGHKIQEVIVDQRLVPQISWQPVSIHDLNKMGKWINGFVKFLSRRTFEQALSTPAIEQAKSPSEALATIQQIEFQNSEARCDPLLTNVPQGELLIIEDDK